MSEEPIDSPLAGLKGDARIVQRARDRFKRARDHQGDADRNFLNDIKFANADAYNHYQWPDTTWQDRDDEGRPCLTINKTRVHNNITINESLQSKSSIKVRPTGGVATYESSEAMQAIIRRIEYISKADSVYEKAIRDQVDGGIGYVLIDTRYVNDRTFDQEIILKRCKDPLCIYLDPDIQESDGSDAKWGFIFEPLAKEVFDRKYPKFRNKVGAAPSLGNDDNWLTEDHILVADYFEREEKKDTLVSYVEPQTGKRQEKLESELREEAGDELFEALMLQIENGEIDGKTREVTTQSVRWYRIGGDVVMERGDWAGSYIPICRCVGMETYIEGRYDRKGQTRAMIDAQKMLNYNASASVEFGALQNKAPYVGPARAFEGQEQWKDANVKNYAFLAYNDIDEEAPPEMQRIEPPQRQEPPKIAPVYMQGMQDAERQLMMVSGQFQAQLGEEDQQSAASGKAINERQRQGDTATYHFVEHQSDMLRYIGVQLLDLIPKIYDTDRILHVLGEDGTKRMIQIAPDQQEAVQELKQENDEAAIISLNPKVGEYDCMSDVGPNYATQRQEAWNAISLILQQNMQLAGTIGDLLFKYGDFPGADEIMERLRRQIQHMQPWLFSDQLPPGVVQLQAELSQVQKLNADLMQKLAQMQISIKGKDERRDIEASRAETDRLKVVIDALKLTMQPDQRMLFEQELLKSRHDATLDMVKEANSAYLQDYYAPAQSNGAGP